MQKKYFLHSIVQTFDGPTAPSSDSAGPALVAAMQAQGSKHDL